MKLAIIVLIVIKTIDDSPQTIFHAAVLLSRHHINLLLEL